MAEDLASHIQALLGGFDRTMGLQITHATPDEVVGELQVGEQHLQPYGVVHGGVYAGIIETLCSIGAAINIGSDQSVVGLENSTSFLRAVRSGTLRAVARPLSRGRRAQLWEAHVRDEGDRLVATGRLRSMVLARGAALAGEVVAVARETR